MKKTNTLKTESSIFKVSTEGRIISTKSDLSSLNEKKSLWSGCEFE